MSRRIGRPKIIHRLDQTPAKEIAPHPIHEGFRKERMRGYPGCQLRPRITPRVRRNSTTVRENRFDLLPATRMDNFHTFPRISKVGFFSRRVVEEDGCPEARPFGSTELAEERSKSPKLILVPLFIGVIVTLSTIQTSTQENPHLFRHDILGAGLFSERQKVAGRTIIALRRQAFEGDLLIRLVLGHALPDPTPINIAVFGRTC